MCGNDKNAPKQALLALLYTGWGSTVWSGDDEEEGNYTFSIKI